jgi:hypothetical protein
MQPTAPQPPQQHLQVQPPAGSSVVGEGGDRNPLPRWWAKTKYGHESDGDTTPRKMVWILGSEGDGGGAPKQRLLCRSRQAPGPVASCLSSQHHPSEEEERQWSGRPFPHQNLDLLVRGDGESSRTWLRRHPLQVGASVAETHGEDEESTWRGRRGEDLEDGERGLSVGSLVYWSCFSSDNSISLFRGSKSHVGPPTSKEMCNSR